MGSGISRPLGESRFEIVPNELAEFLSGYSLDDDGMERFLAKQLCDLRD
ncbi:MAG: hypothetical protein VX839_06035 [Verrucomicrobiota bacterium]|nr:hypothetical protein [Verrucomicrobiota bacterium]